MRSRPRCRSRRLCFLSRGVNRVGKLLRRLEAICGALRHRLLHDRVHLGRQLNV